MSVSGDVTIRATSQDYIDWQLLQEDGTTPISLESAISVTLRLQNKVDKSVIEFKTTDDPQKFFITDATNGKVQLRPAADDFTSIASYDFHIIVIDSIGNHPVPEDRDYTLQVIDHYPPS